MDRPSSSPPLLNAKNVPHLATAVAGVITTAQGLAAFAQAPNPAACDLVEVRLGEVDVLSAGWREHIAALEAAGIPVLLTLRNNLEGGVWEDTDPRRLEIFTEMMPRVSGVDVEWNSQIREQVLTAADQHGTPVVVSFHDFTATPPQALLEDLIVQMHDSRSGFRLPKIACRIQAPEDVQRLLTLVQTTPFPVCLIGMDDQNGTPTRLALARAGSRISYAYLDAPSAPGQISSPELIRLLNASAPQ